jgi:hypothetical protein
MTKVIVGIHCQVPLNGAVPGDNSLPTHTGLVPRLHFLPSCAEQRHLKRPSFTSAVITGRFHISTHLQQFLIAKPSSIRISITHAIFAPHRFHTINYNIQTRYFTEEASQMRVQFIGSLWEI